MNEFLNYLAERKYNLYHSLYIAKPQAYTSEECFNRIKTKSKYEEVLQLINFLPLEEKKIVEKRYDERVNL